MLKNCKKSYFLAVFNTFLGYTCNVHDIMFKCLIAIVSENGHIVMWYGIYNEENKELQGGKIRRKKMEKMHFFC